MRTADYRLDLEAASLNAALDTLPTFLRDPARGELERDLAARPDLLAVLRFIWNTSQPLRAWAATMEIRGYRLVRPIGGGGQGDVWLATKVNGGLDIVYAIKLPRPGTMTAERIQEEMVLADRARGNIHILSIFEAFYVDGQAVIVVPFIEGGSLAGTLREREGRPLPDDRALAIVESILDAIVYLHEMGIVHGDIKPANILMVSGEPVVTDFGLARSSIDARDAGPAGTYPYMPPEAWMEGGSPGEDRDIFAVGAILYELLTGERAFTNKTHPFTPAPPLPEGTPDSLCKLVEHCLAELPKDRYRSAAELREAVRSVRKKLSPRALTSRPPGPRRPWAAIGVAASMGLTGAAVFVAFAVETRPRPVVTRPVYVNEPTPADVNTSLCEIDTVATQPEDLTGTIRGRVLQRMNGLIGGCLSAVANPHMSLPNDLTVAFTILDTGKVVQERAEGSPDVMADMQVCAMRAARNTGFESPEHRSVAVRASFRLLSPPSAPTPPVR